MIYRTNGTDASVRRGEQKVETALLEMPGLHNIVQAYGSRRPLEGVAILGCVTLTAQTGAFNLALRKLGADLSWCSDNQFASDPDVIAYLRAGGFRIFAEPNMTLERYFECMAAAAAVFMDHPHVQIHDDGCDITRYLADQYPEFMRRVNGISEQTTCGITFLGHLFRADKLHCPAIDVAHGYLKRFDNFYGLQQSLVHALTGVGFTVASKAIAVIGYGPVGEGAAKQLRGLGASVSVVECDITKLAKASFDGFNPVSVEDALTMCDLVLSATGCLLTISGEMLQRSARDGVILGNIGHGQAEIDVEWLWSTGARTDINPHRAAYTLADGRTIHLLCEGALVNFLAGSGNPSRELSLTFTATALAQMALAETRRGTRAPFATRICSLPPEIDEECGTLNFPELLPKLYQLTDKQREYLGLAWRATADVG